jgi:hypothetical protein
MNRSKIDSGSNFGHKRAAWVIWLEWGALAALVLGVGVYLVWKPLNPMANPDAARALALVQTHPARHATTIRQELDSIVQGSRKGNRSPSIGEWTVQHNNLTPDREGYVVRVELRLPGDQGNRWVEWEYAWLVRVSPASVVALTRPATEVMPE